ncbi:MAG: SMI1/KNR4 family protein [Desulfamplus sp.]|nr:SMI1/KNR4 family protein [Desulfamplus sp.]
MEKDTWDKLEDMFNKSPLMKAEAVEADVVNKLSEYVGFTLSLDYVEFMNRYGGAIVGSYSIFGLGAADAMGDNEASAIDVTKRFRDDGWAGTENWLVISMDHSGNPVGLDLDGKVWLSDHDAGAVSQLADSFEEYLRKWCLKCCRAGSDQAERPFTRVL